MERERERKRRERERGGWRERDGWRDSERDKEERKRVEREKVRGIIGVGEREKELEYNPYWQSFQSTKQ
jgi:hypothetical protein